MKHFIGGAALGFVAGLLMIVKNDNKPLQCAIVALFLGIAAWGLLP